MEQPHISLQNPLEKRRQKDIKDLQVRVHARAKGKLSAGTAMLVVAHACMLRKRGRIMVNAVKKLLCLLRFDLRHP